MAKMMCKGDNVVVISGDSRHLPYEKRIGKIIHVDRRKSRVVVEGVNLRKVALKRGAQQAKGGYVDKECPIHISNVMLKDTFDQKSKKDSFDKK